MIQKYKGTTPKEKLLSIQGDAHVNPKSSLGALHPLQSSTKPGSRLGGCFSLWSHC